MTKLSLIDAVAEKMVMQKSSVERILETMISAVQYSLKHGGRVSMGGLGILTVVEKEARVARNPKTGEQVQVPFRKVAKFRAGKELKGLLNAGEVEKKL